MQLGKVVIIMANTDSRAISIWPQKQLHSTPGGWTTVGPHDFHFIRVQKGAYSVGSIL